MSSLNSANYIKHNASEASAVCFWGTIRKKKKANKGIFKVIEVLNFQIQLKFVKVQWPFKLISVLG